MERPSGTSTRHVLPYGELSPAQFERLCLWVVKHEGYLRPEHLGEAGSEQGRDVIAYRKTDSGEQLWYFQCKRYQTISAATLTKEVEKYNKLVAADPTKKPFGIVFVTNAVLSDRTREKVRKACGAQGYACEFWARTELDMYVKESPDIAAEFFNVTPPPLPHDKSSTPRIITFNRKRAAALTGLMVLSLLAGVLVYRIFLKGPQTAIANSLPAVMDCPPLTVTIAGFKSASNKVNDDTIAQEVRSHFYSELEKLTTPPDRSDRKKMEIKDRDGKVTTNPHRDEWESEAIKLGQSQDGQAHLVVYGILENAPLKIWVYVCHVNLCGTQIAAAANPPPVQSTKAQTWAFECYGQDKNEVGEQVVRIAFFVAGLAHYEQHEYDQALAVLKESTDPAARLYEGLISYDLGQQNDSKADLIDAIEKFQKIVNDRSDPGSSQEIKAYANANAGNAFLLLSQLDPQQTENHLRDASNSYVQALNYYQDTLGLPRKDLARQGIETSIRRAWGTTKSNLAVATIWQARQEPQQRQDLFNQAEEDLEDVRKQCQIKDYPSEWLGATLNLATFWAFEQFARVENPQAKLLSAETEFKKASGLLEKDPSFNRPELQYRWASIQANLGAIYSNEAFGTEMQLDAAKACYEKASTVFTPDKSLLDWARNEDDMGLVFTKQARFAFAEDKKQANDLLDKAIDKFNSALKVYQEKGFLCDWALATCSLADAKREKSKQDNDQALLSEAVGLSERAVDTIQGAPGSCSALDLAKAQQILGDLYYEMGRLDKARNAYTAALGIWKLYGYSYNEHAAENRLSKIP